MNKNISTLIILATVCIGLLPVAYAAARSGRITSDTPDLVTISNAESTFRRAHGSYFQVLFDDQLPLSEPGTLADYVDPAAVPPNTQINTYVAESGAGYDVYWKIPATRRENGSINSVGYGPEASSFTFTVILPYIPSASSTGNTARPERSPR